MLDPMAISNYLGGLLIALGLYPFVLVGIQFAVFEEKKRRRITNWYNAACFILVAVLFYLHMQTEVIYGKSLLDAWHAQNPE